MFEDFEEQETDVSPDSPDRAIVWAIWAKKEASSLTAEEAWAILHERYPDDPRFLLLNAYAELAEPTASGAWTAAYFLRKVERILGGADAALEGHVRELLGFGAAILAGAKGDDAKMLAAIRSRLALEGPPETKRDDRAGLRLRRFEREVLRELHDRTVDDKPLGERTAAPPPVTPEAIWRAAVADASKAKKAYAANASFAKDELVTHPKFGVGVVTGTEPGRVHILFESGARKLVSA